MRVEQNFEKASLFERLILDSTQNSFHNISNFWIKASYLPITLKKTL
jgi:hypothetical protein